MNIFIDNRSGTPIYDQIYTQIKNLIISGEFIENDPLPSIRNLAKDLRISVITTKRAYDELEREGFIYTVQAKGCFVAPKNTEMLREQNLRKIEEHIIEIKKLSASCNMTTDDIIAMIKYLDEENII
ncbi:MAG: GntR family transcriptional regulator [Ruminococcus sp.]|nr:GntR family transcriptional regulator [Ruminococcus sp.]